MLEGCTNMLYERFEAEASKSPAAIAVQDGCHMLTYKELKDKVTVIANGISQQTGLSESRFIGVCMESCVDTVATIFAILKAGFAYVPIDPAYPSDRINYIVNDSELSLVITNDKTIAKFKEEDKYPLVHSRPFKCLELLTKRYPEVSQNNLNNNNLAYVIYTSGSTGNPKGVMVSIQNVLNYAAWAKDYLDLNKNEILDCSSSFSFDLTVTVSIVPLLYGSSVVICEEKTKKSPTQYLKHLQENKVAIAKMTPSYFNVLCDFVEEFNLATVKKIILGGENLSLKHVKKWLSKYPKHTIINEYGPTETTVGVTKAVINKDNVHNIEYIPLGNPAPNAILNVLNKNKSMVSKGEIGELYIAGSCVTQGYLNRNKLTKEKFIVLQNEEGSAPVTMYKTGDLVRVHGSFEQLEYVGRTDEQIKLRGYRVELGEIENQLLAFNGIKLAAILHRKNKEHDDLIAYYLPDKNVSVNKNTLKNFLKISLPDYMLPSIYVELEEATLTVNGKLDKRNLPDIATPFQGKKNIRQPCSKDVTTLGQLKDIWSDLVSWAGIDLSANFYDMGGNSLTPPLSG